MSPHTVIVAVTADVAVLIVSSAIRSGSEKGALASEAIAYYSQAHAAALSPASTTPDTLLP